MFSRHGAMHGTACLGASRSGMAREYLPVKQYNTKCILEGCTNSAYICPSEEKNPFSGRCFQHWKDSSARTSVIRPGECWLCGANRQRTFRANADYRCRFCGYFGVPGHHSQCRQSQAFIWRRKNASRKEESWDRDHIKETCDCDCSKWMEWMVRTSRSVSNPEPYPLL